jgi:hypothetical protein
MRVPGLVQQKNKHKVDRMHTFTPGLMLADDRRLGYRAQNMASRSEKQHGLTRVTRM